MDGDEITMIHRCALLDAEIFAVTEVPGGCMANDDTVFWLLDNWFAGVAHFVRWKAQAFVETIGFLVEWQFGEFFLDLVAEDYSLGL